MRQQPGLLANYIFFNIFGDILADGSIKFENDRNKDRPNIHLNIKN